MITRENLVPDSRRCRDAHTATDRTSQRVNYPIYAHQLRGQSKGAVCVGLTNDVVSKSTAFEVRIDGIDISLIQHFRRAERMFNL